MYHKGFLILLGSVMHVYMISLGMLAARKHHRRTERLHSVKIIKQDR